MPVLEVEILGVTQVQGSGFPTVLLRHENRVLLISIGLSEAGAIQMELLHDKPSRPMTHDLICNLLAGLRGRLVSVCIYRLMDQTFYAYLTLEQLDADGNIEQVLRIDARPSDGIAIALRTQSPVYVAEEVMEEAGHDAALLGPLFGESGEQEGQEGGMDDDVQEDDEEFPE